MNTVLVFKEKLEKEAEFRQWLSITKEAADQSWVQKARPWFQQHFGPKGVLGGVDPRWWSTPIMMLLSALAAKSMGAGTWGTLGAALGGAGAGFVGGTAAHQLAQPGKEELKPDWYLDPWKKWFGQSQSKQPAQTPSPAGIESTHPSTSVYPGGSSPIEKMRSMVPPNPGKPY